MTSSGSARTPSYSRRIRWLAIAIAVVIALYTAGWFAVASFLESRVATALAGASTNGVRAECSNPRGKGYPFRIGLFCDGLVLEQPDAGVSLAAGAFRSAAQVYDPGRVIAELDAPLRLTLRQIPQGLGLTWDMLRASSRLATPIPTRASVEGRGLVAVAGPGSAKPLPLARAESFEAHMRTRGEDADLAARFANVAIEPFLLKGRALPPLSGEADMALTNGVAFLAERGRSLHGLSGEVRTLVLNLGPDAGLTLSGPVAVGEDGLVDATLSLRLRNPKRLGEVLSQAIPEARDQINTAMSGFAALAGAGGETPPLPVRIAGGRVTIGFIPVGNLPPLD